MFHHWFLCWGWCGCNPQWLAVMVWWMEQSQQANTMRDKCDTLVCVCVSHRACVCLFSWVSVFVSALALCSLPKCVCTQICMYVCAMRWACGHCWGKKMSRDAWRCVTIALCVSLWTESDEVMFVPHWPDILVAAHCLFFSLSLSLAQSHTHLSLSLSLVAMPPLSVTSCVYLWLCARAVNVCSVCPISSPCCRYDRVEQEVVRKVPQ